VVRKLRQKMSRTQPAGILMTELGVGIAWRPDEPPTPKSVE